jgi:pilus assembly protein Flp/PilA
VAKVKKLVNRRNPKNTKNQYQKGEDKMERIKNFFKDESGASAVEYGLLVALIAVVIIVAVGSLGSALNTKFEAAATGVTNAGS